MEENVFLQSLWTSIALDLQSVVKEIRNPHDALFFGKCPIVGTNLTDAFSLFSQHQKQTTRISEGIMRAMSEKRNVFLTYRSIADKEEVAVSMFVEYRQEGVCLHATEVDAADMQRVEETPMEDSERTKLCRIFFEHLPVGLEVYDKHGRLIEINSQEINTVGIGSREEVIGLSLFENPNLPPDVLTKLMAGEDVHFTLNYDFGKVNQTGYYATGKSGNNLLTISITIIRNEGGHIENYLLISQDVTERMEYQQKYETLYNQNMKILNFLPVGVEIYMPNGVLSYLSETDCRIFGVDQKEIMGMQLSIDDNPNLPLEVKEAVRRGVSVQARFPYRFSAVTDNEYYSYSHEQEVLYIECIGQPIIDADGKLQNYVFIVQDVTEDVRREEELRQSKRKIEVATHDANIMLWEFDVHSRFFFNENEPLTGFGINTPIPIEKFINSLHASDREAAATIIHRMAAGEDFSFSLDARISFPGSNELQYCTFNGTTYERNANGRVVRFVGSCKNNTELQRSKILQDNILNNIPIPIHIKDIENDSRYVFCNEESTRMFNTRIGGSIYDVMSEEQVARVEKTDQEVFSTGKPYYGVERIELRDGRNYDVVVRKSVIYDGSKRMLLNVRWDQSLQNDLQRRAKVLLLSMQAMNAYTWYYDPEKDRVSFGEGFERVGRNSQQLNTREKFASFIHPEDKERFIDTQLEQLEKESGEWVVEYRIDLENAGKYEWWETRGLIETTIIDEVPRKFMLGMSICIESHKKTEFELRNAKMQAEQSDKLKSAFLANMSHEIRTPLNAIVGFSDLLMICDEPQEREQYMQIISSNTELLLKLIGDILDLSKIESGSLDLKFDEFDLAEYFDYLATSMNQRAVNPDVKLIAHNPCSHCTVKLDRSRVAQILTNYVTNGIKYTPHGFIEMGYECLSEGIKFYVKDTGIGIAQEKKNKVFHRFEKLDEFAQGTGLGLSICKAIAESMGGSVGFESELGKGSTFWAILPCLPVATDTPH